MSTTPETIVIDVADAGARLRGTSKGSPASEAVAKCGRPWTWGRKAGCWVLPRSLRPETVDYQVWRVTEALEAIGCTVTVTGGDDRETDDERAARRLDRDRQLVDIHETRADRAGARADAAYTDMRQTMDMIPPGQPVLVGHHSERRHRRDLAKIDRKMGQAVEGWRERDREEGLATAAAQRVARAEAGPVVPQFSNNNVSRGDYVKTRWGWRLVIRANAKSVTFTPPFVGPAWWDGQLRTDRMGWDKVVDVKPNTDGQAVISAFRRVAEAAEHGDAAIVVHEEA